MKKYMWSVLSVEFTRNLCLMANVNENPVTTANLKNKLLARHSICAEPLLVKGGMLNASSGHRSGPR
jgi:hypothetical protein